MSPLAEVRLVSAREIAKNLKGPKGIVLSLLSVAGGALLALVATVGGAPPPAATRVSELQHMRELAHAQQPENVTLLRQIDFKIALASAPPALVGVLDVCVWLAPALVWLVGFDAISGEVQHRTVRYWAGRTRRSSFYLGKVAGLVATVAVITFVMHALIWIVTAARGGGSLGETLAWGVRFWVATLPMAAAWCGVGALVGSLFRTPLTSLLVIGFSFFALFVVGAVVPLILIGVAHGEETSTARTLALLYPNGYEDWLLDPGGTRGSAALLACLGGFLGLPTALGAALHARRDV